MSIIKFTFVPDGHYAYPEVSDDEKPLKFYELVRCYREASCSGYNMGDGDTEEPERDDFESEEEYDEAMQEWNEENDSNAEGMFSDYANYDVYGNTYTIIYSGDAVPNIDEIFQISFDYESNQCHEQFMEDASNTEGVIVVISKGDNNEMAFQGEIFQSEESDNSNDEISGIIIDQYKKGNPKIGIAFEELCKINTGLDEIVKSKLTPEEYLGLKNLGKGGSTLKKFGIF